MWDTIVSNANTSLGLVFLAIMRTCLHYPLVVLGVVGAFGMLVAMLLVQIASIERTLRRSEAQSTRSRH